MLVCELYRCPFSVSTFTGCTIIDVDNKTPHHTNNIKPVCMCTEDWDDSSNV